jgi:hypothetical protein
MQLASGLLQTIYGDLVVEKFATDGRYLLKCLEEVQQSLSDLSELPPSLQPTLRLVDAINLALQPLENVAVAPPQDFSAIEMLGWLELPLDDAPALIVTTVNEGFVPKSPRVDAFLPDNLRRELGLNHDGRDGSEYYAGHGTGATSWGPLMAAAAVGLLGYGVSLVMFVVALRHLGTARTGAYFSTAPFVGASLSLLLLGESPAIVFWMAGALMAIGVWLHVSERHGHAHAHEELDHAHRHRHDAHHQHEHDFPWDGTEPHTHPHHHAPLTHAHPHYPDLHHRHSH